MNNEKQKIKKIIDNNLAFLSANHIDIVHSDLTDSWFVYSYNNQYQYYEYFVHFTTATELVHILLEEFRFLLLSTIDENLPLPEFEKDSPGTLVEDSTPDTKLYAELTSLLKHISTSDLGQGSQFFHAVDQLISSDTPS